MYSVADDGYFSYILPIQLAKNSCRMVRFPPAGALPVHLLNPRPFWVQNPRLLDDLNRAVGHKGFV